MFLRLRISGKASFCYRNRFPAHYTPLHALFAPLTPTRLPFTSATYYNISTNYRLSESYALIQARNRCHNLLSVNYCIHNCALPLHCCHGYYYVCVCPSLASDPTPIIFAATFCNTGTPKRLELHGKFAVHLTV